MQILNQKTLPSRTHPVHYKITNIADTAPAPGQLVATTLAYVFSGDQILLSLHPQRGWGLPGGHREKGESIVQAIQREVTEEACVTIKNIQPIGHICIEYLGPEPDNYKYPYPTRFVQIVKAEVQNIMEFAPFQDSLERRLLSLNDLKELNLAHRDELLWLPYALPHGGAQ